jgi:IPT/TIG domain
MRTSRQRTESRGRHRRTVLTLLLAVAVFAIALGASSTASGYRAKRSCGQPPPGRAACLAMRLLVEPAGGARPQARTRRSAVRTLERTKPYPGFLTPEMLHDAYELPGETPEGATQTIAVVDAYDDPTAEADLAVYDKQFGLPPCTAEDGCFTKVNQKAEPSPLPKVEGGWASEISIDLQMAHATCQNCKLLLVEADSEKFSDLGAGVKAAAKLGASEISNSYGGTEEPSDSSTAASDYHHPGIVVTASSGDCGYLNSGCLRSSRGANFPADSAEVLSVGGTALSESGGIWTSSAWSEGGSGCSEVFTAPPWQSEVAAFAATGCGSGRAIADVSAIGDPSTGVDVYDSTPEEPRVPTGWGVWGGTSVAAPIIAAEFALAGGANGVPDPAATIYRHAGEASSLFDVITGSNGECEAHTICAAGPGFDGPTGLGSPRGLGAFAVAGAPEEISPPTISGFAEEGETLNELHGGWTPDPTAFDYQWERCNVSGHGCTAIPGARAQSLTIPGGGAGYTIRVRETAHDESGPNSAASAPLGPVTSDLPLITAFTPTSAITGSAVTIEGSGLAQATSVTVAGLPAGFTVLSPSKLAVTVPDGTRKGRVSVATPQGVATSRKKFTASLTIRSVSPLLGAAGTLVTLKGVGFNSSSAVSFAGTPATIAKLSARTIKVRVPAGALAGPITVTNSAAPAGTVSSPEPFAP